MSNARGSAGRTSTQLLPELLPPPAALTSVMDSVRLVEKNFGSGVTFSTGSSVKFAGGGGGAVVFSGGGGGVAFEGTGGSVVEGAGGIVDDVVEECARGAGVFPVEQPAAATQRINRRTASK